MRADAIRRWRFSVTDFDDNVAHLDADGGPNGDEPSAEFNGSAAAAMVEGDRRADLWEARTGKLAAKITRDSYGVVGASEQMPGPAARCSNMRTQ